MAPIVEPNRAQLNDLVASYLKTQPIGLGIAIGYASPSFAGLYFAGNIQNQFGSRLKLNDETPFEIASITKTFTSTLYALSIRTISPNQRIGHYLQLNKQLNNIPLDSLMNYTSGLPSDNVDNPAPVPPFWPRPYSMRGCWVFSAPIRRMCSNRKKNALIPILHLPLCRLLLPHPSRVGRRLILHLSGKSARGFLNRSTCRQGFLMKFP